MWLGLADFYAAAGDHVGAENGVGAAVGCLGVGDVIVRVVGVGDVVSVGFA